MASDSPLDLLPPLIVLSGGKSSRMGFPKGLMRYKGVHWLEHQLRQFARFGREAVVVLGHHHEEYQRTLPFLNPIQNEIPAEWPALGGLRVQIAINPRPELGPFSSLVEGLKKLNRSTPVFVLPVDVPAPSEEVWQALHRPCNGCEVAIPTFMGRKGHPVILSAAFSAVLRDVPPESETARLDAQIQALPENRVRLIPVEDPRVCMNLNTPEDFMKFNR